MTLIGRANDTFPRQLVLFDLPSRFSSSDNEEEAPSKDILDIDAPATLPMNTISGNTTTTAPETTDVKTKNGRLSNSSSLLDEDSEGDQELLSLQEKREGRSNKTN
jgi:hypothetical protein